MKTRDDYQGIAPVYDLVLNPFLDHVRRDVAGVLSSRGIKTAVDLGCGTGRQCAFLHDAGIRAFGVDRSQAMLEKAKAATLKDIDYRLEDLTSTSFPDGFSDCTVISLALHEHEAGVQDQMVAEAMRITRKEGFLALLDHAGIEGTASRIMHYIACVPELMAGRKHFRNYMAFMKNKGLQGLVAKYPRLQVVQGQKYLMGGLWFCLAAINT